MKKEDIVIDWKDWDGMRVAVVAELKSSRIATLVLSAQLVFIDGEMARLKDIDEVVRVSDEAGIGKKVVRLIPKLVVIG